MSETVKKIYQQKRDVDNFFVIKLLHLGNRLISFLWSNLKKRGK
jgi:hypothetical protein